MQNQGTHQAAADEGRVFEALRQKAQADLQAEAHDVPESHPIESIVVGGLAFLALVLCSYNVFVRYFFPQLTLDFADEVQVYLVIWAVFLSLGTLTLMDRHVKSDFFVNMFPAKVQRFVAWLSDIAGFIFSAGMTYYGFEVAYQAWDFGDVSTTMLRTPLWIFFAALPAGTFFMAVAYLVRLFRKLKRSA